MNTQLSQLMNRVKKKKNGCWEWTGFRVKEGYGGVAWQGKVKRAHRIFYELTVGPVPEGLVLDHLCRVRHCVNPDHLEAVTQKVNVQRGMGHGSRDECPYGHPLVSRSGERRYCKVCNRLRMRERRKLLQTSPAESFNGLS